MRYLLALLFTCFLLSNAGADTIDDSLKSDFSRQETIKIRFEVNKRLFSYEAGKFKIENVNKNRNKIRAHYRQNCSVGDYGAHDSS